MTVDIIDSVYISQCFVIIWAYKSPISSTLCSNNQAKFYGKQQT